MKNKIDEIVTVSNLRSAAGGRSFSRGEAYFQNGAVHRLYCDGTQLTGDVHGTHVYHARIMNDNGCLDGECNCPVGQDGDFCKHLVALGLAYLDRQKDAPPEKNSSAFNWKNFLQKCDKDELIKIILEMSPNNTDVIERYRMANLPSSGNAKLRELKSKVDELYSLAEDMEENYEDYLDGYDEDDSASEFREQSELLLKVLETLAAQKEFALLWETSSYAIGEFLDSSNADLDAVQDFVEGLSRSFLEAVDANVKSNDDVFRQFQEWEAKGDNFGYGVISDILYGLPDAIMEKWAVGALEKWRGYPPRKFGEYSNSHDDERDYIEQNLMTWAKRNKDDKLKLDILEKKMRYARDVIELSEEYHRQGMHGKIIPLLKMAHNVFEHDREITDLLSKALMESGDDSQAVKLAWDVFSKEPFSDTALDRLQVVSGKSKCWKEYYQKVLDFLQKQEEKENKSNSLSFFHGSMRERRVQVLFKHGDQQAAWELAQGAKLSERCWLTLAAWRSETLPQEAASVLDKLLTDALRPTGEDAYRHVIDLLMIYRKYLQMANREKDFAAYCTMLRTEYKRRRLLLEQMNIAKL